ncbi:oxidoreductase, partial [Flavihumibacter sediminis]|nr:oxidoreductase [Flavihumibacter sediminis]
PLKNIVNFIHQQGSIAGIQLAHAGRKASCDLPWQGGKQLAIAEGGWETIAPSAIPFYPSDRVPHELTQSEIHELTEQFAAAAKRALAAGFKIVEIHAAHGYLLHEFFSPLSNKRTDQ